MAAGDRSLSLAMVNPPQRRIPIAEKDAPPGVSRSLRRKTGALARDDYFFILGNDSDYRDRNQVGRKTLRYNVIQNEVALQGLPVASAMKPLATEEGSPCVTKSGNGALSVYWPGPRSYS